MAELVVDAGFWSGLVPEAGELECRTSDGRLLGVMLTAERYRKMVYQAANASVTDEDIAAARAEPVGATTAEMLARLRSME